MHDSRSKLEIEVRLDSLLGNSLGDSLSVSTEEYKMERGRSTLAGDAKEAPTKEDMKLTPRTA
jgi:hypothetical protein